MSNPQFPPNPSHIPRYGTGTLGQWSPTPGPWIGTGP